MSEQFLQRSLFAAVDAILGAIVTSHTPKCNESAKIGQIINWGLTILIVSVFPVLLTNYDTAQTRAVDKMAGIVTKSIWQPCICQPNELKREIKKKNGGASKNLGGPWPTQAPT